mmetsp:Transcript_2816/g.4414  ORF Transcript_2816/g.4414 Transcript_2816/m.4414 type:complete len:213 (+) Transcript_2816:111-749(+)
MLKLNFNATPCLSPSSFLSLFSILIVVASFDFGIALPQFISKDEVISSSGGRFLLKMPTYTSKTSKALCWTAASASTNFNEIAGKILFAIVSRSSANFSLILLYVSSAFNRAGMKLSDVNLFNAGITNLLIWNKFKNSHMLPRNIALLTRIDASSSPANLIKYRISFSTFGGLSIGSKSKLALSVISRIFECVSLKPEQTESNMELISSDFR